MHTHKIHKLKLQPWIGSYLLPADAKLLKAAWQGKEVCIWYEFGGEGMASRKLAVIPTGCEFDSRGLVYFDSVVSDDLVFHIYEEQDNG